MEFHHFWSMDAVPAPPPQNALKTNRKSMVPGAIRRRITKLWPFWVNLVIIGEFPPISRFRAENALFRTFREISCPRTSPGRGRGGRSLNKQNPESALPAPGPGARAGGPEQRTGGPEQRTGGPEQRTGGPERAFPKPFAWPRIHSSPQTPRTQVTL